MEQSTGNVGILDALREVADGASAGRVYGEPISHGGVVVLPAAKVSGGAGGGGGQGQAEEGHEQSGTGGGFGLAAKPLGVFVIHEDGKVRWQPAIDVNRVIMGGQIVAAALVLVVRAVIKARTAGAPARRQALRSLAWLEILRRFRR